jgi:hypothetical protein
MAQPVKSETTAAETAEKTGAAQTQPAAPAQSPTGDAAWAVPAKLGKPSLYVVLGLVLLFNVPLIHYYVFRSQVPATVALPYRDDFSSDDTVEKNYWSTGGMWRVVNGELLSPGVKNNPLWLKASLPQNVAVEFDARSMSPEGDLKVEIFGDGSDHASGYVLVHGGWNNSVSIIARLDEHGSSLASLQAEAQRRGGTDLVQTGVFTKDTRVRVEAAPYPVQVGKTYHWRIERRGSVITWFIDGNLFMQFDDPFPMAGKGHDRFGFTSWEAQLYFDNLKIEPL